MNTTDDVGIIYWVNLVEFIIVSCMQQWHALSENFHLYCEINSEIFDNIADKMKFF